MTVSRALGGNLLAAVWGELDDARDDRSEWAFTSSMVTGLRGSLSGSGWTTRFPSVARLDSGGESNSGPALADYAITTDTTGSGHILDADTAFLWRLDEQKANARSALMDSGTIVLHANAPTEAKTATPRYFGPVINGERKLARYFDGADDTHVGASNGTVLNTCKAPCTWEFFVYRTGNVTGHPITVGTSGSLVGRIAVLSTGFLYYFWEVTGVDQIYQQTAGRPVPLYVWTHCAIVKRAATVDFYVGGVLQQSLAWTGAGPNGANAAINIGSNLNVNLWMLGGLKDLKLTSRDKSDAEIAAAAGLLSTTFELPAEVDTILLYRMDEIADMHIDSGPYHLDLLPSSDAGVFAVPSLIADPAQTGRAVYYYGSHTAGVATQDPVPGSLGYGVAKMRDILLSEIGWTLECWIFLHEPHNGQRGIFCFGNTGMAASWLNFLTIDVLANRTIQFWSEYGSDLDSVVSSSGTLTAGRHHLAVRRNANPGGGNHTVSIFIDGVFVEDLIGVVPYAGGADVTQPFVLGYGALESGSVFAGILDDVRISSIPRSNAEILESYNRGAGVTGAGGGAPPSIAIVSPDPGEAPGDPGAFSTDLATAQQTPIVVEIDSPDGVGYVCCVCRYPGARNEIVVFARGAFRGEFAARSSWELDGTIVRLHCLPDGGWPESGDPDDITFDLDAVGGDGTNLTTTRIS